MPTQISPLPEIPARDLKKADPARLNRVLRLLAQQIATTQGQLGKITIPASLEAQNLTLAPQSVSDLPSDNQALTFGLANALFSPQAQRLASVTNNYLNNTIQGLGSGGNGQGGVIEGTHSERLANFPASSLTAGTIYYETDRTVFYMVEVISSVNTWVYVSGVMTGTVLTDTRPTDLGTNDAEFLYLATDTFVVYQWSGSEWQFYVNREPEISDSHSNRLSSYPSTYWSVGQVFYEDDRTVEYIVQDSTGTVNTSGTAVTWSTGFKFDTTSNWKTITINGIDYPISSKTNATHLVLSSSAGVQVGVAYTVASGRWQYKSGTFHCEQTDIPNDLSQNDNGFLCGVTDYRHTLIWEGGINFNFAEGDSGSNYYQLADKNPADNSTSSGSGWHTMDGTLVDYLKFDGSLGTKTLPNVASTPAFLKGGSGTGALVAPHAAVITGNTASATTGISVSAASGASPASVSSTSGAAAGVDFSAVTGINGGGGGGGGGAVTDPGHVHGVGTLANDTTSTPEAFYSVLWFRQ